jgi:hypothetical protein
VNKQKQRVKFFEEIYFQKKKIKKGQATSIAPLQPLTLAPFPAWGIQQELVVEDLPAAKLTIILVLQ